MSDNPHLDEAHADNGGWVKSELAALPYEEFERRCNEALRRIREQEATV